MSFDFSSLFWAFFAIMVLQPFLMGQWYAARRAQAIRAIEKSHATRVITMIHRQERRSLFGFAVSRRRQSRRPRPQYRRSPPKPGERSTTRRQARSRRGRRPDMQPTPRIDASIWGSRMAGRRTGAKEDSTSADLCDPADDKDHSGWRRTIAASNQAQL
jgi:hypothetical protein